MSLWTRTALVTALFILGICLGWMIRDNWQLADTNTNSNVAETGAETEVLNTAADGIAELQLLLEANQYKDAVSKMHQLSNTDYVSALSRLYSYAAELLDQRRCVEQKQLFNLFFEDFEKDVQGLLLQANCQLTLQEYEDAISNFYEARTFDLSARQEAAINKLIADAVVNHDEQLRKLGKLGELDFFYQTMLIKEPTASQYYLHLARIRKDSGDIDGSIAALLQIQNDVQIGHSAMELLEEMQSEKVQIRSSADIIPLQVNGSRMIVNAVLDGHIALKLLLDTGAAISILEPAILQQAGYRLELAETKYFKTANGIVQASVVETAKLAVASHVEENLWVGSLNLDLGAEADGLLGMNFLKHYRFSVDQVEKLLFLSRRE